MLVLKRGYYLYAFFLKLNHFLLYEEPLEVIHLDDGGNGKHHDSIQWKPGSLCVNVLYKIQKFVKTMNTYLMIQIILLKTETIKRQFVYFVPFKSRRSSSLFFWYFISSFIAQTSSSSFLSSAAIGY